MFIKTFTNTYKVETFEDFTNMPLRYHNNNKAVEWYLEDEFLNKLLYKYSDWDLISVIDAIKDITEIFDFTCHLQFEELMKIKFDLIYWNECIDVYYKELHSSKEEAMYDFLIEYLEVDDSETIILDIEKYFNNYEYNIISINNTYYIYSEKRCINNIR